ncbi:MAG: hypothetical protein ABFD76_15335 [Smithella sp.]
MKKIFFIVAMAIMLMASNSFAGADLKVIGKTTDALIVTGNGYLKSLIVNTDGTNSVTVSIYDNTAASGSKVISTFVITTSSVNRLFTIEFLPNEIPFTKGLYVDVTTSGTVTYDVTFEKD